LDGDWIHAVVFGVLIGGTSTGFWSMVKQTIPDIGKPSDPPGPMTTTNVTVNVEAQTPYDPPQEPPT